MARPDPRAALEALDDEALRAEARARGLPVGRTLSRSQLLALLAGDDEEGGEAEEAALPAGAEPAPLPTVTLARLYAQQGLEEEAAVLCRSVLASSPGDARARRLLERLASAPDPDGAGGRALAREARHRFARFQPGVEPAEGRALAELPEHYGGPLCELMARSPTGRPGCVAPSAVYVALLSCLSPTMSVTRSGRGKSSAGCRQTISLNASSVYRPVRRSMDARSRAEMSSSRESSW